MSEADLERFERYMRMGKARDAHLAVARAIAANRLTREPCQLCGIRKVDAHHRDYAEPLDVFWFCRRCHGFVTRIERMLKQCAQAVEIARLDDNLRPIAEVFAQELTIRAHRNPPTNVTYTTELRAYVEKCLVLLLRCSSSNTASKPRWKSYPWLKRQAEKAS